MSRFNLSSQSSSPSTSASRSRRSAAASSAGRFGSINLSRRPVSTAFSLQPASGFPWDATLLDRLQSQLTRFHE
jgi:hypothetical protein